MPKTKEMSLLDPAIAGPALRSAAAKLDPRRLIKNPVMFVTEIVAALSTLLFLRNLALGIEGSLVLGQIALWLWFTVYFAHNRLLTEIWGPAHGNDLQYLRVFIGRIRAKLKDDPADPRFILNEPGVGYRFLES
jgi:K+-transporting ATPase ATPase B chain